MLARPFRNPHKGLTSVPNACIVTVMSTQIRLITQDGSIRQGPFKIDRGTEPLPAGTKVGTLTVYQPHAVRIDTRRGEDWLTIVDPDWVVYEGVGVVL